MVDITRSGITSLFTVFPTYLLINWFYSFINMYEHFRWIISIIPKIRFSINLKNPKYLFVIICCLYFSRSCNIQFFQLQETRI
jgi:hypothetical protein